MQYIEIDQDRVKCLSKLLSLAPQFRRPSRNQGELRDFEEIDVLRTSRLNHGLYIHSDPGTGKSVFSSALLQSEQRLSEGFVGYYSFSGMDLRRTTTTSFLACLIRQILISDPPSFDIVRSLYTAMEKQSLWSSQTLWAMLATLLTSPRVESFHCIVDGVHNWDSSREKHLPQILSDLGNGRFSMELYFVFIGELRPELSSLFQSFDSFPTIRLNSRGFCSRLVRKQADHLLTQLCEKTTLLVTQGLKNRLEDKLLECKSLDQLSITVEILKRGMCSGFAYPKYCNAEESVDEDLDFPSTVRILPDPHHSSYSLISLSSELELLPYNISSLVVNTFNSLPEWAIGALSWILRAQRPISPGELAFALSLVEHQDTTYFDEARLSLDISKALKHEFGPLVVIDDDGVSLHHEQVKDAFLDIVDFRGTSEPRDNSTSLPTKRAGILSHWDITRILLKFLASKGFTRETKNAIRHDYLFQSRNPIVSFAAYAILFWPEHFRHGKEQGSHAKQLLSLLPRDDALEEWQGLYCNLGGNLLRPHFRTKDPLLLASEFGFSDVVEACLPGREVEHILQAVLCAICGGNLDIVESLLQNHKLGKLSSAGHIQILENGLIEAAHRGFEEIATYLLDYFERSEIPTMEFFKANPLLLSEMAEFGFLSLVKLFVSRKAPVDGMHGKSSPLHLASKHGHMLVFNYLLRRNRDVKLENAETTRAYDPARCDRAEDDKTACNGINLYQPDADNKTVLHLAVQNGHHEIVSTLLHTENLSPKRAGTDNDGRTALHLAAQNGHVSYTRGESMLQELLRHWKDGINECDDMGETPLSLAMNNGHEKVARVLLASGARRDTSDVKWGTPLLKAVTQSYHSIEFFMPTRYYRTDNFMNVESLIQEAAKHGFDDVYKFCLSMYRPKEHINSRDESGRTALHYAALGGHDKMVSLLLRDGADARSTDLRGETALMSATSSQKWASVNALIRDPKFRPLENVKACESLLVDLTRCEFPCSFAEVKERAETIRYLLESGVDPNSRDPSSNLTTLQLAAQWGMMEVISLLLEFGASPCLRSPSNGWTAVFYAVQHNHIEAVRTLLHRCGGPLVSDNAGWTLLHRARAIPIMELLVRADRTTLEARTADGSTPLHTSVESPKTTEWLLRNGASVDARTFHKETALMLAAKRGFYQTVKVVLAFKPNLRDPDIYGRNALHHAVQNNSADVLDVLLDACNGDVLIINGKDRQHETPLHIAVRLSHVDSVDCLLRKSRKHEVHHDSQDKNGNTPLLIAIKANNTMMIEKLLAFGPPARSRNRNHESALLLAIKDNNEAIWRRLLTFENKDYLNSGMGMLQPTVLHFLASIGNLKTLKELVESHGADVNAHGGRYGTPLQAAAVAGFDEVVFYLLQKGANAKAHGYLFGHALTAAAFSGSRNCLTKILEQGVSVDEKDSQRRTALHMAAWSGDVSNFQVLVEDGKADIFITDIQGRTVLHHAAMGGSKDIVELLLQNPIYAEKLNVPDAHGWWPLHWGCRSSNNKELITLLARGMPGNWPQMETPYHWTPERIASFHNASDLFDDWSPEAVKTGTRSVGYCHQDMSCDGCHQKVSRMH